MKKLFFLLLVCIVSEKVFAQNDFARIAMDSLQNILLHQKTAHDSLLTLQKMIDLTPIREGETDVYPDHYRPLFSLNRRLKLIDSTPYILMQRGNMLWNKRRYEESLAVFQQAVELFDKQHKVIYPLLLNMRLLYNFINNQDDRLHYYQKKLEYYLVNGPYENTAPCYHGIAGYYLYKGAFNQTINNYMKGAEVFRHFNPHYYDNVISVIGRSYSEWGNYDKANYYVQVALPLAKRLKDSLTISYCDFTLGEIAFHEGKYRESIGWSKQTQHYIKKLSSQRTAAILSMESRAYLKLNQPDTALVYLEQAKIMTDSLGLKTVSYVGYTEIDYNYYLYYLVKGNMNAAGKSLLLAVKKATEEKGVPIQLKYLRELGFFYQKQGKSELSEKYFAEYFTAYDAYEKDLGDFKIAEYEIDQNDKLQREHIDQLRQEKAVQDYQLSRRNLLLWGSLVVLLLISALLVFIYRQLHVNKKTLLSLRKTQRQLIQSEKMASLGELTAGIAHEIQNPLNFVNNFSEVSVELLDEMDEELDKGDIQEAKTIGADLKQNLQKIQHHGKRADFIVKGMLEHSRTGTGERQPTNINVLADEFLKLSYHGLRAKDNTFNAGMITCFDEKLPKVNVVQQDIGRVLLNLFNNAFYAVKQKQKTAGPDYKPEVTVSTGTENGHVVIKVKDNGVGIPDAIKEKIMQPFFTTKPTGEGTGLGLSLTYDMVVKGHGGSIVVNTVEGEGAEFIIKLPLS